MTYRERREAKADKLREWAEKREAHASATLTAVEPFTRDHAFNTQPGHIPGRDRINATEQRAFESLSKAQSMTQRAGGIESQLDHAIYDDDPDAIERLTEKLAELQAKREKIKDENAAARKAGTDTHPAYVLTNLSGNITRTRERIAALTRQKESPETYGWRYLSVVRRTGNCYKCGEEIPAGQCALWSKQLDAIRHHNCA